MFKGGSKAQITLFIILGIILLIIVVALILLFRKSPSVEQTKVESVPLEFKQVQEFVSKCIHDAAIDGIIELGNHGGYIEPLNNLFNPKSLRYVPNQPTRSDLVSVGSGDSNLVPYYLHIPGESSFYNFEYFTSAPEVEDMEYQLSRYIEFYASDCIDSFDAEMSGGFDLSVSDYGLASVQIKERIVEINYQRQINASRLDKTVKLESYNAIVNFPLLKYYNMALEIAAEEYSKQFTESFTLGLIGYYSGVSASKLPPFVEYSEEPYIITWTNQKVRHDLDNLLTSYAPALQVVGTRDFTLIEPDDSVDTAFIKSMSIDIFNKTINDTSVSFFYSPQTLNLKVQPGKGNLIRPSIRFEEGNSNIPSERVNRYQFYYDVSYPLFVEIRGYDYSTEIPEFSFLFALESNLIENKPALMWELGLGTAEWDESFLNTTIILNADDLYSADGERLDYEPRTFTKSLFCEEETWISGNASLIVSDGSGKGLSDVNFMFACGDYDNCFVGTSEIDVASGNSIWSSALPICEGGLLYLSKSGYESKKLPVTTFEDVGQVLADQTLQQIRAISAKVVKKQIQKVFERDKDWNWIPQTENLGNSEAINSEHEQVIITISQVGSNVGTPISGSIIFGKDGVESQEISLVPGTYEVQGTLIDYNGVIIPRECARVCGLTCLFSETKYPDEPVELETAPWGGVELVENNYATVKISASDLDNNKEVVFTILKLPDLTKSKPSGGCIEHLNEMAKISEYSSRYSSQLMPKFS